MYNMKKLDSSLGYLSKDEFERLFAENDYQEYIMAKTIRVWFGCLVHYFLKKPNHR